jgi:uncharacterized membrane protein YgcG
MEDTLKQLEVQLQARLPPAALERLAAIDAWGETQGACLSVVVCMYARRTLAQACWWCVVVCIRVVVCVCTTHIGRRTTGCTPPPPPHTHIHTCTGIPHAGTIAVALLCLVLLLVSTALLAGESRSRDWTPRLHSPIDKPTDASHHTTSQTRRRRHLQRRRQRGRQREKAEGRAGEGGGRAPCGAMWRGQDGDISSGAGGARLPSCCFALACLRSGSKINTRFIRIIPSKSHTLTTHTCPQHASCCHSSHLTTPSTKQHINTSIPNHTQE